MMPHGWPWSSPQVTGHADFWYPIGWRFEPADQISACPLLLRAARAAIQAFRRRASLTCTPLPTGRGGYAAACPERGNRDSRLVGNDAPAGGTGKPVIGAEARCLRDASGRAAGPPLVLPLAVDACGGEAVQGLPDAGDAFGVPGDGGVGFEQS